MKYYIVSQDTRINDIVHVINGPMDINFTHICHEKAHYIRSRTLLTCRPNQKLIFSDILTMPFLMFSAKLRRIVSIYQNDIPYKEIVLLEQKHCLTSLYFLPIVPILECVTNPFRSSEGFKSNHKPILDYDQCKNLSIFKFKEIGSIHTVISLELLESILIRKCVGIMFEQVNMC